MVGVCGVLNTRRASCVNACCNLPLAFSRRKAYLKITDGGILIHRMGDRQRVA